MQSGRIEAAAGQGPVDRRDSETDPRAGPWRGVAALDPFQLTAQFSKQNLPVRGT